MKVKADKPKQRVADVTSGRKKKKKKRHFKREKCHLVRQNIRKMMQD